MHILQHDTKVYYLFIDITIKITKIAPYRSKCICQQKANIQCEMPIVSKPYKGLKKMLEINQCIQKVYQNNITA
jgi:hypothetical protein